MNKKNNGQKINYSKIIAAHTLFKTYVFYQIFKLSNVKKKTNNFCLQAKIYKKMEISIEILNKKLCRVCLKDSKSLQSLFIEKNSSVLEKLRSFIEIEVNRIQKLAQNLFSNFFLTSRTKKSLNFQNGFVILA